MTVYRVKDADTSFLRTELGTLVTGPDAITTIEQAVADSTRPLYIVGDYAVETAQKADIKPDLAVIDYKRERKPYEPEIALPDYNQLHAANEQGTITKNAYETVKTALDSLPALVEIDGEEDLIGLAVIALGEPGGTLLFGSPGIHDEEGVKRVEITEPLQKTVTEMLSPP